MAHFSRLAENLNFYIKPGLLWKPDFYNRMLSPSAASSVEPLNCHPAIYQTHSPGPQSGPTYQVAPARDLQGPCERNWRVKAWHGDLGQGFILDGPQGHSSS